MSDEFDLRTAFQHPRFPKSAPYDGAWIKENQMGPNALWLTEWLCESMDLKPGMNVLDMGCGRAMSSIFLAREFGVRVWANDLWIPATENWARIQSADLADRVFPIHAEAHALPYAHGFFDAIVSMDSYQYYGTDDLYLPYIAPFLKPGGQLGIVVPALMKDLGSKRPAHLFEPRADGSVFWQDECWCFHTLEWWRQHWTESSLIDVHVADVLENGWKLWIHHERAVDAAGGWIFPSEEPTLEKDEGEYLGFVRLTATRRG